MKVIMKNQFIFYYINNKMDSEIIDIMYPYYLGVNPPAGYVKLGGQLYVLEKDGSNRIFAKQNPSSSEPFVKLDDSSSWGVSKDFVVDITEPNFQVCKTECDNDPSCKGYNTIQSGQGFGLEQGWGCYLKSSPEIPTANDKIDYYRKNVPLPTYEEYLNKDIGGNNLRCVENPGGGWPQWAENARKECTNDSNCKGYNIIHRGGVWGDKWGYCLKTTNTVPTNVSNKIDYYVKKEGQTSGPLTYDFYPKKDVSGYDLRVIRNPTNFDPSYSKKYVEDYSIYRAPFGRLIPPFTGRLSSVLYFDRFGLNNVNNIEDELLREPGKPKYLNLSLSSGKLYLILTSKSVQFCCKNNNLGEECGAGQNALNSNNPRCKKIGESICTSSNPKDFFGQFCQREYCKTDARSIKPGNCDADYRALCNIKKDLSVSGEDYPYYKKYPDYCACFMGRDFLVPMCNYYVDALGIKRNIKAQNALGLNVNDPNQCKQACKINPLCRLGAQVPYNMTRGDNPVVLGADFPDECKEIDLCVQDVTVNQSGDNIGKLTINQTANCKTVLQKVCTNSTYTPCNELTISGNKYTYKRKLLEDKDDGQCADPGTSFVCAEFMIDPVDIGSISCDKKKEKVSYNFVNTFSDASAPDVKTAVNHLINEGILDKFKPSFLTTFKGSNIIYNPVTNIVTAETDCKNCVVGYTGGDCSLVQNNRKWTKYLSLTDILTPQKNGGEVCKINNTLLPVDCPLDKDCSLRINKKDNYCIDGSYGYEFDILSYPSGNGKGCSDVASTMIGNELSNPSIDIDYNNHILKASTSCNDCIVDFVEDENELGGKCTLVDGQYLKKKFAKVVKKETSNGRCPLEKLNLVNTKVSITEKCSTTQDCSFKSLSDECDDNEGIRTIKYIKDNSASGEGKSCEIVGEQISKEYDNVSNVNYSNNILTINSSCEISSDCKVELKSKKCENGKRKDVYGIIFNSKGRGKTCENVVREIVNDTTLNVRGAEAGKEDGNKVIVEGSCPNFEQLDRQADTKKFGAISLVVFILIILFAIFFL